VAGQVVGGLGDPGADDEGEAGVFDRVQVARGQHPGVGDHDHSGDAVAFLELLQDRQDGGGLGGVALEQVDLQREPGRVDQQPHLHLGVNPVFLAHADLAQRVFVFGLEMQRGAVIHDQGAEPARGRRERRAHLGDLVPVIVVVAALEGAPQGPHAWAGRTEFGQHPHRAGLRRGLDDPSHRHRPERLIAKDLEPHPCVGGGEYLPQHQRRGRHHPATGLDRKGPPAPRRCGRLVVQHGLPGGG
jgi:hypothetical protein